METRRSSFKGVPKMRRPAVLLLVSSTTSTVLVVLGTATMMSSIILLFCGQSISGFAVTPMHHHHHQRHGLLARAENAPGVVLCQLSVVGPYQLPQQSVSPGSRRKFTTEQHQPQHHHYSTTIPRTVLPMYAKEGTDESTSNGVMPNTDSEISNEPVKKISRQARAGGRRRRQPKNNKETIRQTKGQGKWPNWVIGGVLLALFLSLSSMWNEGGTSPSYVYYQSTVFESTIVQEDGRRETSRQESFRSNLPDLVRQQQEQQQRLDRSTTRLLPEADDEAERVLNDAMEMQRRLWNDWFY